MAINKAIIQIRRGPKDDLQFDKLLPGELAIATDAPLMWFCWSVGEVEQIPTSGNIEEVIAKIIEEYLKENPVAGIREIYMRVFDGYIQYSSDGKIYNNLIAVSDLKGDPGEKGEKGDTGSKGVGISKIVQTVTSTEDNGQNVYTATLTNGNTSQFVVRNGSKGSQGSPGAQGVGIQNISQSTGNLDGGKNTITIVLTNGNVKEVFTYNGKNGSDANVTLANIVNALGFTPVSEEFVNNQVSTIPKFELEVVDSLPTSNIKETTVYLVSSGDESDNIYTEYIYKNGKWEKLGSQTLDLSKYAEKSTTLDGYGITDGATKEEVSRLSQEIDDLVATDYVITEAESVLARVIEAQGNRTFNMPVITDLHNNGGASDAQITHACQGIGYIADRIKINAFACLGDHTDYDGSNWEKCLRDIIDCNGHKHKVRNVDYLEVQGNHDYSANRSHLTSKLISAFSTDVVWGDKLGGYFHKDYEDYKLRVIGVNTSEIAWIGVSPEQYRWFIETLDLSDKEDAGEWQILIISHVPLDYDTFTVFSYVLDAYMKGTSWTNGTYSCDYTGKNQATIIACVHGHIHNFLVEKMYLGNSSTAERIDVLRIAIPEVTELYSNHYSAPWKHDTTYSKVANTAKDTSFNILCIDLDEKKIEAICYGAGVDRTIDYDNLSSGEVETPDEPEVPSGGYTNLVNTTPTKDTTITTSSEGWLDNVRINSSSAIATADGNHITNIIPIGNAEVLRIKNMDINGGYGRIYVYTGTTFVHAFTPTTYPDSFITLTDDYAEITISAMRETYEGTGRTFDSIRIGGTLTGTKEDVIITLDEEITDSNSGSYTNIIDTVGYTDNHRLSTSTGELKAQTGYVTTGLIDLSNYPLNTPQTIRSSGVDFDYTKYSYCAICTYGEDGTLATANFTNDFGDADAIYDENGNLNFQISHTSKVKGFKVCGYGKGDNLIITINEEIN